MNWKPVEAVGQSDTERQWTQDVLCRVSMCSVCAFFSGSKTRGMFTIIACAATGSAGRSANWNPVRFEFVLDTRSDMYFCSPASHMNVAFVPSVRGPIFDGSGHTASRSAYSTGGKSKTANVSVGNQPRYSPTSNGIPRVRFQSCVSRHSTTRHSEADGAGHATRSLADPLTVTVLPASSKP